ncbi:uncharacterized protein LOC121833981 [Ixodes scapularis]|uniref:uncharacterized protein LOC121833981 n=1 Tax=Ixodes scapularis TaxID=6945 RepID=UPI001C392694|nr:uncharacterized protein LOC121833981 [Ixodes scapularis]
MTIETLNHYTVDQGFAYKLERAFEELGAVRQCEFLYKALVAVKRMTRVDVAFRNVIEFINFVLRRDDYRVMNVVLKNNKIDVECYERVDIVEKQICKRQWRVEFKEKRDGNKYVPTLLNDTSTLLGYSSKKLMQHITKARTTLLTNGDVEPRVIRDLKPYVDAYATAILRLLLLYIEEIFSHAREATRGMAVGARTAAKITAVMLVSLCNYAAVRVKFSQNNKPQDVINLLVEESNRLYTSNVENGVYRCDTDYMTLRTVMPAERVTDDVNIIDPAISTTLRDHNELIMKSSDTIPVPRTNHYVLALQKEKAPATEVSVLNIASIIEQCMSNGRVDSRFVEVHKQSDQGTQELNRFYSQACCVSPRNLGLFLQCLNFEMMDSDMFGATLQCLKMTKGIPTPRQEEIATYSNTALFRMATNLFYHTRFCRSYRGENTYLYDSRFFNDFLLWVQSPNYLEHHISPSVSSSIISWCTSMSTAMHTTRDANGAKCAMAAISTCEVDQRVLADFLNMFIKLFIEDETEISVINKKFLEKELLKAFASVSNCYNLFRGQFVSATALRLFLARCRWSVADDVEVIVPVETKHLNRLICDSDDLLSNSMRDKLRKTMEDVSTMMAPLLSNPSTSTPRSKDDDSNVPICI